MNTKHENAAKLMKTKDATATKYAILLVLGAALSTVIMGQGITFVGSNRLPTYDLRKPLPLTLSDAYELAVRHLADATNRFHCVSATCLHGTNQWSTGWDFTFSNTNGDHANVTVDFIKTTRIDPKSEALLK